ncbi:MAG: hypothetical protein JXJ04_03220 [Spirochaetales bacterium]|nr:hypothetical protein [Spirochaetales bacterium]
MNDLLEEKVEVQKTINKESNNDLQKYIQITHRIAEEFKRSRIQKMKSKKSYSPE